MRKRSSVLNLFQKGRQDLKPSCWIGRISRLFERYEKALAAIEDPLLREAAILYFIEGWPVISSIADKNDLVTHLGISEAQMRRG